ncbi:hypothetical protein KCU99_g53, partial [Aureobasidium melanogenum]
MFLLLRSIQSRHPAHNETCRNQILLICLDKVGTAREDDRRRDDACKHSKGAKERACPSCLFHKGKLRLEEEAIVVVAYESFFGSEGFNQATTFLGKGSLRCGLRTNCIWTVVLEVVGHYVNDIVSASGIENDIVCNIEIESHRVQADNYLKEQ